MVNKFEPVFVLNVTAFKRQQNVKYKYFLVTILTTLKRKENYFEAMLDILSD